VFILKAKQQLKLYCLIKGGSYRCLNQKAQGVPYLSDSIVS